MGVRSRRDLISCRNGTATELRQSIVVQATFLVLTSPANLVAAYGEIGVKSVSDSLNGAVGQQPYTEDEDAKTNCFTPTSLAHSRRLRVPLQFTAHIETRKTRIVRTTEGVDDERQ